MSIGARSLAWLSLALLITVTAPPVAAYEFDTHEAMSAAAFQLSSLPSRLPAYGIQVGDSLPGQVRFKWTRLRPDEWVAKGGRDEDWPDVRVLRHFYDPYHDRPFTLGGQIGDRAPDWALEDTRDFPDQNHSYKDARAALFLGLTEPDKAARERSLGHTFYALGHVIHLIQDIAQPQHVRNDLHLVQTPWASLLEAYVEGLVGSGKFVPTGDVDPAAVLGKIGRVRDLWATGSGAAIGRLGMAAFTNANFVSAGTNFNDLHDGAIGGDFPSPVLDLTQISSVTSAARCRDDALAPSGLTFYGNRFTDPITGREVENDRMTTYSIFDQELRARGSGLIFALNCFNFDKVADILVSRAVSYSAALLDYFFRGSILATDELDPQDARFRIFSIFNGSPDETADGTFALYVEPDDGTRTLLQSWSLSLGPGDGTAVAVQRLPLDTPPTTRCMLVFRGNLGQEDDAVAGGFVPCPLEVPPPAPPSPTVWTCRLFARPFATPWELQLLETQQVATDDPEVPPALVPPFIPGMDTFWDCVH